MEKDEEEEREKWSVGMGSGWYAKNLKLSRRRGEEEKRVRWGDGATGNRKRPGVQSKNPFSF